MIMKSMLAVRALRADSRMPRRWKFYTVVLCSIILISCFGNEGRLPSELRLTNVIYKERKQNLVGPGGLNHSLTLYELRSDIAERINQEGLRYLNSLPSAKNYETNKNRDDLGGLAPYWTPFEYWSRTPIKKDQRWIRRSWAVDEGDQPTLEDFVGYLNQEDAFMRSIDRNIEKLLHDIIRSDGSYYAYGGYRDKGVLIVSSEIGKAFHLHRD